MVWKEGIANYTIDEFCDATGIKPNLIKIDVDGNETEILNGGKNTFSDDRFGKNHVPYNREFKIPESTLLKIRDNIKKKLI